MNRAVAARVGIGFCLCALPGAAHFLSVSRGSLRVAGTEAIYEIRLPLADLPADDAGRRASLDALELEADGVGGQRVKADCRAESPKALYICEATYRFPAPPPKLTVRCNFPAAISPHHVHILESGQGQAARQTIFDIVSREAEIRFTPPTRWELIRSQGAAGIRRIASSPESLLFVLALALAGRRRRESVECAGAFLAAQGVVAVLGWSFGWNLPARFLEAAAALSVAYLAAEMLFLPAAGRRWLVCAGIGCFHGLFLAAFLDLSDMQPGYFLAGALGCEALLLAPLGVLRRKTVGTGVERLIALLLLVCGIGWFGLRLIR